jgi:RimJ/RimL family protein N-acetyltransferase
MKKGMDHYYEKLGIIKRKNQVDFMKIYLDGETVILRIIDDSIDTIKLLTKCRHAYRKWFGTDFEITELKTTKWIREGIIKNQDRSLFMIFSQEQKIGCIGTIRYDKEKNSAALDAMMKDPDFHFPKLMETVEKVFLRWMFERLKLTKITGYLFKDNTRMMHVHKKCGWKKIDEIPLKLIENEDGEKWIKIKNPDDIPERFFDEIEITYEDLMKSFGKIEFEFLD